MAHFDNSYQVTGKVCPPSLPMKMMITSGQWSPEPLAPSVLQSLVVESRAQDSRTNLPESLCAVVSEAKVLLRTDEAASIVNLPYYFCNFCEHHTDSRALLLKHLSQKHIFRCNLCSFSSFNRCSLIQHQLHTHIDAEEVSPILSAKYLQLSLPQLQSTLHPANRAPSETVTSESSTNLVCSATSQETNFLLPDPQDRRNDREHDLVSSTQQASPILGNRFLSAENSNLVTDSIPHFLDIGHSFVSSSNISPMKNDVSNTDTEVDGKILSSEPRALEEFNVPTLERCVSPLENTCNQQQVSSTQVAVTKYSTLQSTRLGHCNTSTLSESVKQGTTILPSCLGNFLFQRLDKEEEEHQKRDIDRGMVSGNKQTEKKYDILRSLLGEEPSPKVNLPEARPLLKGSKSLQGKESETFPSGDFDPHKRDTFKSASDMSLKELLMQPRPSLSREHVQLQANFTSTSFEHHLSDPAIVLVCGFCNFECLSKSQLAAHVKECRHRNESHTSANLHGNIEEDSSATEWRAASREILTYVNRETSFKGNIKTSLPPTECVASEMLRSLLQNVSENESKNGGNMKSLNRPYSSYTELLNKHFGDNCSVAQDSSGILRLNHSGLRRSDRIRQNKELRSAYVISHDEDDGDELRYSKKRKLEYSSDSEDEDFQFYHDDNMSSSDDSYHSSSDSADKQRKRKKSKRVCQKISNAEKYESDKTCLHCSFSNENTFILRNHLRVCHPFCVPFAESHCKGGKKKLLYFCQGVSGKCTFVSWKAPKIFSHIKDCYVGLLDGFISEGQEDFSLVLSSLGIASKLMTSSPSIYRCLQCNSSNHDLQPTLEHVSKHHADSVAGVLHVTVSSQQRKSTQVSMLCVRCKADIPVKGWHFHSCRQLGNKTVERERNVVESALSVSGDKFLEGESVSTEDVSLESTNSSKKASPEANDYVYSEKSIKSAGPDEKVMVKEEKFDVIESEAGNLIAGDTIEEVKASSFKISTTPTKHHLDNPNSEVSSPCVIENCFSVNPILSSESESSTVMCASQNQSLEKSSMFNSRNFKDTTSEHPNKNIETNSTYKSSLAQGTGSSHNTVDIECVSGMSNSNKEQTSVLHSLLVSNPPDLSTFQAFSLLQNLLKNNNSSEIPVSSTVSTSSHTVSPQNQTCVNDVYSALQSSQEKKPKIESSQSSFMPYTCIPKESNQCDQLLSKIKAEIDSHVECKLNSKAFRGCSPQSFKHRDSDSNLKSHDGKESLLDSTKTSIKDTGTVVNHSESSKATRASCSPHSPPSAVIPTPPFVPVHQKLSSPSPPQFTPKMKPISPTSPHIPLQQVRPFLTPSSSSSSAVTQIEQTCSTSSTSHLFSSPASQNFQSSPFTNLLRGLLTMSKQKNGK